MIYVAQFYLKISSAMSGVDVPCPGFDPCKRLKDNGQRIAKLAKMWGIPFEFRGLAGKWESFTARDFNLRDDEVLAVKLCCIHTIHDECVLSGSPRELLLKRVRSLNPKVHMELRQRTTAILPHSICDVVYCSGPTPGNLACRALVADFAYSTLLSVRKGNPASYGLISDYSI